MVSTNAKSIILFVIAFGLVLGPISFFLQQNHQSPDNPGNGSTNYTEPPLLTQTKQYEGEVQGLVVSKEGILFLNAVSDYGNTDELNKTLSSLDGVKSVNITKEDNPGETGLYLYDIRLGIDPDKSEKINYFMLTTLTQEPFVFSVNSAGVPATVSFPEKVTLSKYPSGEQEAVAVPPEVPGFVFAYTNAGQNATFLLSAYFSGNTLTDILALEKSKLYQPPTETHTENTTATVANMTGHGVTSTLQYADKINNLTEFKAELLDNGLNATIQYGAPLEFFEAEVKNSSGFVEALNSSGIKAQSRPGGAIVWISDSLEDTLAAVKAADPDATYELPTASLTVEAADSIPLSLIPGEVSEQYAFGFFDVPAFNDTVFGKMPLAAAEGDSLDVKVTYKTIFGEIQHPVTVELA